jgi:ribonuclease E
MATTDARPGFKLPWGSDRSESDSTDAAEAAPPGTTDEPAATVEHTDAAAPDPIVNESTTDLAPRDDPWRLTDQPAVVAEPAPKRKPNKLMADLTRAMQTAAESARDESLARLQTDAKAYVETIHTRSATEAEELRQTADADIAGIREWSKNEIARIRDETDQKVTDRKARLESDTEAHAGRIERRIEGVQRHVAWFETEMAGFFERLLAEQDPTRLAAMAESLPEPPTFDDFENLPEPPAPAPVEPAAEAEADAVDAFVAEPVAEETHEAPAEAPVAEAGEPVSEGDGEGYAEFAPEPEENPEATFAAIQAAAEAAAAAEATGDTGFAEAQADDDDAPVSDETPAGDGGDPRLAALGFGAESPFDPAPQTDGETPEAEAAGPVEEIPAIPDDALAARLAGLVPGEGEATDADQRTTRVVVTGLVSVASIASFKRSLGKIEGVASVGVSSGPDGEFVFAVAHGAEIDLPQAVASLPGFAAQVTSVTDDTVSVAARDPETES